MTCEKRYKEGDCEVPWHRTDVGQRSFDSQVSTSERSCKAKIKKEKAMWEACENQWSIKTTTTMNINELYSYSRCGLTTMNINKLYSYSICGLANQMIAEENEYLVLF